MSKGERLESQTYEQAVLKIGRLGSFAPGDYLSLCRTCGVHFDGDKRAISCLPCEVERLKKLSATTPATAQSPCPGEEALREKIVRLIRDNVSADWGVDSVGRVCAYTTSNTIGQAADAILAALALPLPVGGGKLAAFYVGVGG